MELEGKIALVTGAGGGGAGGMGKGIALCMAQAGADVAVNDIDQNAAEDTAARVKALGRRSMVVIADVSKEDQAIKMVDRVVQEWGGVDILVNNVGHGLPVLVEDMTAEEWHFVLAKNLDAPFYCSKAVIPVMKARGGGKIITVASMAGKTVTSLTGAAYTAAKAGVIGFTRQLAWEVGPYHINVNAICPAGVFSSYRPAPQDVVENMTKKIPIRQVTTSEDIGWAAVFLASDRARTITGATLDVDGGITNSAGDWDTYVRVRKEWVAKNRK
ncbi:MAG: SDR family oxidoreductase [Dehalococcoidales bacterium]|jgi:3-oxoacyl-[acyl-carrier protein] reductase|nr:SDR family oxidoreductase [Dehalococcoidales bacterium]